MQTDHLHLLLDGKWLDLCISSILELLRFQVRKVYELSITPVKTTNSCQSKLMAIIPILDIAAWLYPRDGASKVHRLWWNHSLNELARCIGRVETAALILTRCLLASPVLRTCDRERCWNLAVWKHSPQIFCCQLQRLTGDTDGSFPGN